ncbi:tumor necrosis factor receptor superfamily member 19 isoform X3 [Alligator mississippiensis]|nr:tumor necrosis factor receptor superfamily member 19 isoform X3 [Alligator mississippiensis]
MNTFFIGERFYNKTMDTEGLQRLNKILKMLMLLLAYLLSRATCETGDCREQEFRDHAGNCILCEQCGPGMELSKECGFGYGEDAQCMICRPNRFKEDWGFQKCKPCLDCALVNRFQKTNCSAMSNAICGDCLPGFYRKTKLGGFQDMECVPCGDPPPPYEPHWSMRSQDIHYNGSELSCFDRPRLNEYDHRTCCQCQRDPSQTCGPVHLIPSLCCDEACSIEHSSHSCTFHSQTTLHERVSNSVGEMIPAFLGSLSHTVCGDLSDVWPLMKNPTSCDGISFCESYPELTGGSANSFQPEAENTVNIDSDNEQDLSDVLISAKSDSEKCAESIESSRCSTCMDASFMQDSAAAKNQPMTGHDRTINVSID